MTISTKREQDKLTVKLDGRLDTLTSPQLEEELNDKLIGLKNLVLDFTGIHYVSSAGLRVLLKFHREIRAQEGCMVVRGVNPEVRSVFIVTGFSDILNME